MKIQLNGEDYHISPDEEMTLIGQLQQMATHFYSNFGEGWRLAGKAAAREALRQIESDVRAKHGNDAAMQIRPPRHTDPVEHLIKVMSFILRGALQHATLELGTSTTDHTITHLSVSIENQSQSGGQVAPDGDIGVRKDNSAQIP